MGTRCRNPEYEVDVRTTAIIYTEEFAVHNASVGLTQARPNYYDKGGCGPIVPNTDAAFIYFFNISNVLLIE